LTQYLQEFYGIIKNLKLLSPTAFNFFHTSTQLLAKKLSKMIVARSLKSF